MMGGGAGVRNRLRAGDRADDTRLGTPMLLCSEYAVGCARDGHHAVGHKVGTMKKAFITGIIGQDGAYLSKLLGVVAQLCLQKIHIVNPCG